MGKDEYTLEEAQMKAVIVEIEVSQEQIQQVRKYLSADCQHVDDATVRRFIKATAGDLDQTLQRLEHTTRWQLKVQPEKIVCEACAKDPRSHYMHVVAFDKIQRPVIYSCLEMASNKVYEDNQQHMLNTFETTLRCMPPDIEQWVWVCDFHGFGLTDVSPKLAKSFLSISADNYPERLGLFIIVDAPKLFSVLWKAVRTFVDPKTYRKIRFVNYDPEPKKGASELRAQLDEVFDAETAAWFLCEMATNREKKAAATKLYNVAHIAKAARSGMLRPETDGHDARGTPALLKLFQMQPDILEPQASATTA